MAVPSLAQPSWLGSGQLCSSSCRKIGFGCKGISAWTAGYPCRGYGVGTLSCPLGSLKPDGSARVCFTQSQTAKAPALCCRDGKRRGGGGGGGPGAGDVGGGWGGAGAWFR